MPRNEEMTRAEAQANIRAHEQRHGKSMKPSDDDIKRGVGRHDVPTQAEIDDDPDWFKQGKPKPWKDDEE